MKHSAFQDFHSFLESEMAAFKGSFKDYIYALPNLFKALCKLLGAQKLAPEDRQMILAALGYLVAPEDLLPEALYGPAGYIDDVFVCATVLDRLVKKYGSHFVEPYWDRKTQLVEEFLSAALPETRQDLGKLADKVLAFTGLEEA